MISEKIQNASLEMRNLLLKSEIVHLYSEDKYLDSNIVRVNGRDCVHFGSCSYLGLEFDPRIKERSIKAIEDFGTQFSISRAYLSAPLYEELEHNFNKIFNRNVVITPTTTLGHISAIPTLISEKDAIILDHQVHSSVQVAAQLLKTSGVSINMIRHNNMEMLENLINRLKNKFEKIWYLADGIYSMYGDKIPMDDIYILMKKYTQFHLYVDDAHGIGCYGKHGKGFVLDHPNLNDRTYVAASLAKAFASGGGVLAVPNAEAAKRISVCGLPMTTSGPIQPGVLGASIATSEIYLSDEINSLQQKLQDNIQYTNVLLSKFNLPLLHNSDSPIFFIGTGAPKLGSNLVKRLLDSGFYVNIGAFPAVPVKNTGIRFTITALHTFEQIEALVESLVYHFPRAMQEENVSMEEICKNFNLPTIDFKQDVEINSVIQYSKLKTEVKSTIEEINKKEWDTLFADEPTFKSAEFESLEKVYCNNDKAENNWDFSYLKILSPNGEVIVAAPFVATIQKDDLFHPEEISEEIEQIRKKSDPYYLTSKVLTMGNPISLGKPIYFDESSEYLEEALEKFLNEANKIKYRFEADSIVLRDFNQISSTVETIFENSGFFKVETFKTYTINQLSETIEVHKSGLSKNSRRHLKRKSEKYLGSFDYQIIEKPTIQEVEKWYAMYLNVAKRKTEVNTFDLPYNLFRELAFSQNWKIHVLKTSDEAFDHEMKTVAVVFVHSDGKIITPNYIGLDYDYLDYHIYQQILYRILQYSIENGFERIELGITAGFEKTRLGAVPTQLFAYMQMDDHYNHSHIDTVHGNKRKAVLI